MLAVGISAGHGLVDKSLVQARSNTVDMTDNASALPTCPQRQQQQKTADRNWLIITHTTAR